MKRSVHALAMALAAISGCGGDDKSAAPARGGEAPAGTAAATAGPIGGATDEGQASPAPPAPQPKAEPMAQDKPKGGQAVGAARVLGDSGLAEEDVKKTVAASFSSFDRCYAHAGGHAKGSVAVRVAITQDGGVSESIVTKSSFRVAKFDDCVANAVKAMKFPKSKGASSYVVPIEFDH